MENTQMKPAELLEQVNKAIAAVLVLSLIHISEPTRP